MPKKNWNTLPKVSASYFAEHVYSIPCRTCLRHTLPKMFTAYLAEILRYVLPYMFAVYTEETLRGDFSLFFLRHMP